MPKGTREDLRAWCAANPRGERTHTRWTKDAADALEVHAGTVRKWMLEMGLAEPGSPKVQALQPPPRPAPARGPHVDRMAPEDRKTVLSIVLNARWIVDHELAEQRRKLEAGDEVEYDARKAQALLNYQRIATEVIETHPGLMELVKAEEGSSAEELSERRRRLAEQAPKPKDADRG